MPGLRLRVGGELISESHARAWAADAPLLGIVGNDLHKQTLGSLAGTPYLVVQESLGRGAMRPVFSDPQDGLDAIRSFSYECARTGASAAAVATPTEVTFEASMPNGRDVVDDMAVAGWARVGDVEFAVELERWPDSRGPLAAAMSAAVAPFMPYWLTGFASADEADEADRNRVGQLVTIFDAWAAESQPAVVHGGGRPVRGGRRRAARSPVEIVEEIAKSPTGPRLKELFGSVCSAGSLLFEPTRLDRRSVQRATSPDSLTTPQSEESRTLARVRVCSTSSVPACRGSGPSERGPARRLPIVRRTQ